jgi:hypothetical protein
LFKSAKKKEGFYRAQGFKTFKVRFCLGIRPGKNKVGPLPAVPEIVFFKYVIPFPGMFQTVFQKSGQGNMVIVAGYIYYFFRGLGARIFPYDEEHQARKTFAESGIVAESFKDKILRGKA